MQSTSHTEKEALEPSSNPASETAPFPTTSETPYQEEDPYSLLTIRKRKYGSRWKQQNLVACRQKFDLLHVIILYVSLGIVFMSVGTLCFFYAASYPKPIEVDYTNCKPSTPPPPPAPTNSCFPSSFIEGDDPVELTKSIDCKCTIEIEIKKENLPDDDRSLVLFFKLTGFHQNIRRYKKDVDWEQIGGNAFSPDNEAIEPQCKMVKIGDKYIYPCGKIANSFFTDEFKMSKEGGQDVPFDTEKIPWSADKGRYKDLSMQQKQDFANSFVLPQAWPDNLKNNFFTTRGVENEHFMVWMRAAALATFKKKYAYLDLTETGKYIIEIQYRYEVQSYKGTKNIVIAADIQDRPVDFFFFYWYITVGGICLLIGPMFLAANCIVNAFHKSSSSAKQSPQSTTDTDSPQTSSDDPQHSQVDIDPPTKNPTERPSIVSVK